jgi:hypothetical protein
VASEEVGSEVASEEVGSEEVASEEVASGEVASEELWQHPDVQCDLSLVFHLAMAMVPVFLSVQKFFLYEMAVGSASLPGL